MSERKPGVVIRLRVSPTECLQILGVLREAGLETKGRSFSSIVSLFLKTACSYFKEDGRIPPIDSFSYGEVMEQFFPSGGMADKMASNIRKVEVKEWEMTLEEAADLLVVLSNKRNEEGLTKEEEEKLRECEKVVYQ